MFNTKIENEEHLFIISRWAYSLGKEIISDSQYATLEEYIKSKGLLPEYTSRTWSEDPCPTLLLKEYNMEELIESVFTFKDTCSIPSITTWSDLKVEFENVKYPLRLSFKRDGFNFHLGYIGGPLYNGNTRARAGNGLSFHNLENVDIPQQIPDTGIWNIIGEATLSKNNFRKLKNMYPHLGLVSQRASVRTALAHPEAHHLLHFSAFNIQELTDRDEIAKKLTDWGFDTPKYRWVNSYEELLKEIEKMGEEAKSEELPSDGIVVEDRDGKIQRAVRLGYWKTDMMKSYVVAIVEESGMFNDIPKIQIRDVLSMENSRHSLIPITNWARIIEYDLCVGSPIAFTLTSKAAPVFDLEGTRLLQKQYFGNYDEFRNMIDIEQEAIKLSKLNL